MGLLYRTIIKARKFSVMNAPGSFIKAQCCKLHPRLEISKVIILFDSRNHCVTLIFIHRPEKSDANFYKSKLLTNACSNIRITVSNFCTDNFFFSSPFHKKYFFYKFILRSGSDVIFYGHKYETELINLPPFYTVKIN